jgi:hypothetical protein
MLLDNRWLWFHMLGGAAAARLLMLWGIWTKTDIVIIVLIGALWFEFIQLVYQDIKKEYGSLLRFLFDAAGDIIGAVAMAGIVVF